MKILREFAPFGPGNMKPVFLARNLEVVGMPRIVGKNHLRFRVRQDGTVIDAIGFGLGNHLPRVSDGRRDLSCVFNVDENDWIPPNGARSPGPSTQLKIKDLK